MKSLAICMHVRPDVAAQLINDRADVARRGAILARLWRWGDCEAWRPASDPRKSWGNLAPVAVVCLFFNPDAEALLAADPEELRPLLRALSPLCWQFITVTDPAGRAAVALQGVTVAEVEASEEDYARAAALARLDVGTLAFTASAN